ncbi:rhamnan synthesis F family protein [Limibaculum sp. FT325]|uniref:rhamnan synthesis F family protein n=1 Tax=Thermohalobaculum sediminis TaxID=2939436 RepID=UPI0020BF1919|nr:rhamnan synthesis F family protein [Limibaculum sediminis]MCL5778963.1 rhamnan synthesis F family protein [Limibaculum sediminis]
MLSPKRRLVILVQYDPGGGLPAFVRIHLEGLRPVASRLVLVSNSPMTSDARLRAESICDKVILRDNIGWDFAGWRDALTTEDMQAWDGVILTNSSIVGPLFPLDPIVEAMEARGSDFWGMVHSRHMGSHLQSYFLAFSPQVIRSETWRRFWEGVEDLRDKRQVIRRYEVGLTPMLRDAGFSFGHLIDDPQFPKSLRLVHIDRLRSRLRVPMNVNYVNKTVELHEEMIKAGMPYLKASLLWGKDIYRMKCINRIKEISGIKYPWSEIVF